MIALAALPTQTMAATAIVQSPWDKEAPTMAMKVKGAALLTRRTFVDEEFGEHAWEEVLRQLPPEDQRVLAGRILAASWYPFDLNDRLDRAIVASVGRGDPTILEAVGARSARSNLTGPHKVFLTLADPQSFLSHTDRIYKLYYDTGYRTYEPTGATSGVMTTREAETFSETDCRTVIGWYKEALRMCGARNVVIREEACRGRGDAFCRYRLSWDL